MYYTITIQKFKNTDPDASSMLGYASLQAAESACFLALASASEANSPVRQCVCIVIDGEGAVYRREKYEEPAQTPSE